MNLTNEGFVLLLRAIAVVEVLYGIPFIFRLVPPNRFFGFKMPSVIPDDDAWYFANRLLGIGSVICGAFLGAMTFVLPLAFSRYDRGVRVLVVVALVLVPLVLAVGYVRRRAEERLKDGE